MVNLFRFIKNKLLFLLTCGFMFLGAAVTGSAQNVYPDKSKKSSLSKPATYQPDRYQLLNVNNIATWVREDGQSNHSPTGESGTTFPRGTSWVVYQDGLVFGSKVYLDADFTQPAPFNQEIRVGGSTYGTGTKGGWVYGNGASAQPVDPNDYFARIYRIRRNWRDLRYEELARDAAETNEIGVEDVTNEQRDQIQSDYSWCWENWPVKRGAPFIDRNENGYYDPPPAGVRVYDLISNNYDEPGIAGVDPSFPADQVIWTVFNDLDRERSTSRFGSEPTGLEIQVTMWAYRSPYVLGNIIFKKWRIINKGGVLIDESGTLGSLYLDSMYVSQWSDPDLGSYSDDLISCDTKLNMGYVYNANAIDAEFSRFNLPPPAVGYDLLQGPIVPSPGDIGKVNFKAKTGYKNLGMTSFAVQPRISPYADPGSGYHNTIKMYKMQRGFQPKLGPDIFYDHPPNTTAGPFPFYGDPVLGTGHIDGLGFDYSPLPGDRVVMINSGPFQMAPGDTQEVVVAMVAGLGADWLSSISVMKFSDKVAQSTYDYGFVFPQAPPKPNLTFTELNGKVLLKWGENREEVEKIENHEIVGFQFEGYNVYQLPNADSYIDEGVKLATFDRINNVTRIYQEQTYPDYETGSYVTLMQNGSDSGLEYALLVDRDQIDPYNFLINGKEYHFAITAYNYHPDGAFGMVSLESNPSVVTVTPHMLNPGERWGNELGDKLTVQHSKGESEGSAEVVIIDPAAITGDSYAIRFASDSEGKISWDLNNVSKNKTILSGMTNQSGIGEYFVTDGFEAVVQSPPPGIRSENGWYVQTGVLGWTAENTSGFKLEGFNGAMGWGGSYPYNQSTVFGHQLYDVIFQFAPTNNNGNVLMPDDPDHSFAYRYLSNAADEPARPEFAPFIVNPTGDFSFQDFTKSVPFAVYAYDREADEMGKRLSIGFLESNVNEGMVDGKWWPPVFDQIDNSAELGPREWFWIFDLEYSETPNQLLSGTNTTMLSGVPKPILFWSTVARDADEGHFIDEDFVLVVNRINGPEDEFIFDTVAPSYDDETAKNDVLQQVNVFPNPYYGPITEIGQQPLPYVTFSHLPEQAIIRIFSLAGQLVRVIEKDRPGQFLRWDLTNASGRYVASGMYIAHIEMERLGVSKVLKLAIVQE